MKRAMLALAVVAVLVGALGAPPASADLSPLSDVFTVYDANFTIVAQFGVREDGTLFIGAGGGACWGPTCGTSEEGNFFYSPVPNLADPAQFDNPTFLVDPNGQISDIFGVAFIPPFDFPSPDHDAFVGFISGGDLGTGAGVLETGQPVDATIYLTPELQRLGYTATFWSAVPLPGTLVLLVVGLAGLGFGFLRRGHV